ncbi:tetratricopeptide repeat protein [Nitrospirillum sp. BR 11164]|uniref:tetratricopeptide repeat protein n=1 Tax=Nitrospirillum sp. BR 11164 TaxID=3104324 RepID=UPI002AFFA08F|nr:tetratricopeptide repeat protein [Nitrospirillum sp. BR 11164]MEA1651391.1 tetratricopeptide repeat protein [Nitrospirillum sp. BR 11164]
MGNRRTGWPRASCALIVAAWAATGLAMAAGSAGAASTQADTPPASSVPAAPPGAKSALDQGIAAFEAGKKVEAVALLTPLAEKGDADAQTYLGWIYEEPLVTITATGSQPAFVPDNTKARAWYEKAAAQGQAHALNNLGSLYFLGRGVPEDRAKGIELFQQAAAKGDIQAQNNLTMIYYNGVGTAKDSQAALMWCERAAIQGDPQSLHFLAALSIAGEGVPHDPAQAYILMLLSPDADADAAKTRTTLEQQLPAAIQQRARELAAAWHPGMPLPTADQTKGRAHPL